MLPPAGVLLKSCFPVILYDLNVQTAGRGGGSSRILSFNSPEL